MTFGEKLKELRLSKGKTQKAMASELGKISVTTYSQYETDILTPSFRRCGKICKVLGIEPEELFKGVEL